MIKEMIVTGQTETEKDYQCVFAEKAPGVPLQDGKTALLSAITFQSTLKEKPFFVTGKMYKISIAEIEKEQTT